MPSIRLRLLKWLIGPILLINLGGATLSYLLAWLPAQSAFDLSLSDAAAAIGARVGEGAHGLQVDLPGQAEQVLRANTVDAIFFVVRDGQHAHLAGDADFPPLRQGAGQRAVLAYDGQVRGLDARIVVLRRQVGSRSVEIGVARTLAARQQTRALILRSLVLLELALTASSVALIWFSVTTGLLPLQGMRAALVQRHAGNLAPLSTPSLPDELTPLARAFDDLLDKVQAGARAQHDFLANVAHQLRTPLAGLRAHLEWLEKTQDGQGETARSIQIMLKLTERIGRQTKQLLALARAEPSHFKRIDLEPVELDKLVEESVQYCVERATARQIDLGYDLQPTPLRGERFLLHDLIDNLIDNALRYTPPGGQVTVRTALQGARATLVVEDSGPGIAPARRSQVFERFVRLDDKTEGSGLGLAIVRDIATVHGAEVVIDSHPDGSGTVISVRFPPAP